MLQSAATFVIAPAFPEIFLLCMLALVLLADALTQGERSYLPRWLSSFTLIAVAAWCAVDIGSGQTVMAMNNMYVSDPLANVLKVGASIAVLLTLWYGEEYAVSRGVGRGDLYVLALFSLLGQFVMISAASLLVMYMGLELMSLALYALVALRRNDGTGSEAAIKYFVLGALASGFLLYGMSMVYGATGTLDLPEIAQAIAQGKADKLVLAFGFVFLVSGVAFKLGAVPFHMWVPDVYQGAPTASALLIAGAPKLATFGLVIRLLVEGMSGSAADWQPMLMVLAVASLALGNVVAIAQTNIKRMLAYSAISHMGFMLLGFVAGATGSEQSVNGYAAAMFYALTYVLTTVAGFGVLLLLSRNGYDVENISDLAGLNRRNPAMAAVVLIVMLSMAGLPPTVGFYAKLGILQNLVAVGYVGVAIFAVIMSLIGAFYYLRVVKTVYFDRGDESLPDGQGVCGGGVLLANGLSLLVLGVFPAGLMAVCLDAMKRALLT